MDRLPDWRNDRDQPVILRAPSALRHRLPDETGVGHWVVNGTAALRAITAVDFVAASSPVGVLRALLRGLRPMPDPTRARSC